MAKDTTTAPEIAVADYPQAIQWNCNQRAAELRAAATIDAKLPALDAEIERKRQELAELQEHYARFGRESTAHLENADLLQGLVRGWCMENSVPLPPEPVVPPATAPSDRVGRMADVMVTRMADLMVADGQQETREQPAVDPADDPLVPLPPNVVDARPETTVPDETTDGQGDETDG